MDKAVELGSTLNWVDVLVLIVLAAFFIYGAIKGFMLQLAGILILIVSIVVATVLSTPIGKWLNGHIASLTPTAAKYIAFGVLFLFTAGLGMALAHLVKGALTKAKVLAYDRFLGGLLGLVKGGILIIVLMQLYLNLFLGDEEQPSGVSAAIVVSQSGRVARWSSEKLLVFMPGDISDKLKDYDKLN